MVLLIVLLKRFFVKKGYILRCFRYLLMLLEISSLHQRKYSLLGKEIISSGAKAYLNRDKVPSKPPCAYAQNGLRL